VEQGTSRSRWSPGVVQHPWGPMVGIRTPPERGCGQLIYVGIGCSYFGHRECWSRPCFLTRHIFHFGYLNSKDGLLIFPPRNIQNSATLSHKQRCFFYSQNESTFVGMFALFCFTSGSRKLDTLILEFTRPESRNDEVVFKFSPKTLTRVKSFDS
jgi:hypothetical protein